ncbi:MAG: hypothetical protein DSM106950_01895 [Stigonema ocellatum SAG 48.90 = DSM 106950]|nr:hypothetical protein [Stigonema ocellatum SAG 48.90 = DSM 106950]
MKYFPIYVTVLVILINLAVVCPSWAESSPSLVNNSDYFKVGQKVIWLYKPRTDAIDVQKIPAEVVKLGSKQVQIKVRKNNEFINRWVNRNRLENFPSIRLSS